MLFHQHPEHIFCLSRLIPAVVAERHRQEIIEAPDAHLRSVFVTRAKRLTLDAQFASHSPIPEEAR
jgi:hypothetical protein